jgi:uncharacterized protein (TIGR02757 family)
MWQVNTERQDGGLSGLLSRLYERYNRRPCVAQDPLRYVYEYDCPGDREVVGLVAALLAYGRLQQILDSVADALGRLGPEPQRFLLQASEQKLRHASGGFAHRFAHGHQFCCFLRAVQRVLQRYGTLQSCFRAHDRPRERTVLPGLTGLAQELRRAGGSLEHLVADPAKGSACKRWHLYLRWMVRSDEVDAGLWEGVSPARLVVPLDAHMWRLCRVLGLTDRKTCDLKAAVEVTESFRRFAPADPVRYDFALMHASAEGDPALRSLMASGDAPCA